MTREDVIKGLNACIADVPDKCWEDGDYPACPYNNRVDGCQLRMMKDVAELLKEQEPKKPYKTQGRWFKSYHCGACGKFIGEIGGDIINFCYHCGQAVKWE